MTGDRGARNNSREETLRRATDTVLAREHYVSPAIFELERTRVFARQWTLAGHISDIPKTGDYFLYQFAGETIIVVRAKEDRVVAHLNVCRHRGFAICDQSRGNTRAFTCPYHRWTYRLDGSLQRAPGMADDTCIDYTTLGLHRVEVEVWAGMIFVWIGSDAPPSLVAKIGEPPSNLRQLDPARIKEAFRETLHIEANWKTLLENYLECYHCAGSHPELGAVMDIRASYEQTGSWQSEYVVAGGTPIRPNLKTVSKSGELVCKALGQFSNRGEIPSGYAEGLVIVPTLTRIIYHIDHVVTHTLNPTGVGSVDWTTRWYVHEKAVAGQDYNVESLTEVWRATNLQDKALCERNYVGVRSLRFLPGPLNPIAEGALRPVLNLYLNLMSTA